MGVGTSASGSGGTGLAPTDYTRVVHSITEHVGKVVPAGASVLVVSRGDDALLDLDGLSAGHFPQDEDGQYLGYYPSDSDAAIAMLEDMRAAGAQYLIFPSTAFWWLEHYGGLRRHLQDNYNLISAHRDCLVFALVDVGSSAFRASDHGDDADGHPLREIAKHLLPAGALIVVANLGEEDWSTLAEFQVWQLPLNATGGTSTTVAHLETMQSNGAEFLIVPRSAFEWLDEHADLTEHLTTHHVLVTHQEHVCDIYELCPSHSQEHDDVSQRDGAPQTAPARKSFLESLFGWTRRSSANGRQV